MEEYYNDDYYYMGNFMETMSATFEDNCITEWYTNFTEPFMIS